MGDFLGVALGFPTVLFSFLLLVVVGFWVAVLLGGADLDLLDSDGGVGPAAGLGLGGVPATVAVSLLVAFGWFISLAGAALLEGTAARAGVLVVALGGAWGLARLAVLPLRRVFEEEAAPSRADFVGRMCVVRTGSVTADFGQAEVTAEDGATALVQVRLLGEERLTAGDTALIYEYDADGEFFWVMPYDAALDPDKVIK
ncbi:hypothetical protein HNP84_000051 [Thermocatellispora tengchongensis]|uniref:DUF1449 family protein n=1 Tax=Thermocatellispora tengchongensis TaxID=1073253 RepID=A0A840NXE1_9ACTN|nr:hypothetical protein [Thermocatellispora tengchongensis]MBB5130363.1 hypothetical protein [Thermocatellispora tengchongensis]